MNTIFAPVPSFFSHKSNLSFSAFFLSFDILFMASTAQKTATNKYEPKTWCHGKITRDSLPTCIPIGAFFSLLDDL